MCRAIQKKTLVVSRFPFLCELSFNDVVFHLSAAFSKCRLEEDERARPPPAWEREKMKTVGAILEVDPVFLNNDFCFFSQWE